MSTKFSKTVVACLAMLFCLGSEVNAQKKLCLREINSQMEGDYTYYGYNKDGRLDSVYQYLGFYDEDSYRLYKYDERGNMIKEEGYAILPSNDNNYREYSKIFEVFYTFDEADRLSSRANYNIDEFSSNHDFYLGGVYVYEYDEKGRMKDRLLYWDEAKTDLFEKTVYSYNDQDQLVKESYITYSYNGQSEDLFIEYYYDEKGRMIKMSTNTMDANTAVFNETGINFYEFDENDNLLSRTSYDIINPDIPCEQHKLLYNETLTSDVAFPINYEDDMDFFVKSKHVARQDSVYKRDVEGVVFQLFDIRDMVYAELDEFSGINNVVNNNSSISFARDTDGNIMINGLDNTECIRIYDAEGKMVSRSLYNGKVNTNALPKGMYILMTRQGNMKFSK